MLHRIILTFLSAAFPLSERSGVNLRGDYGPQWEPVAYKKEESASESQMDVDETQVVKQEDEMAVDSEGGKESGAAQEKEKKPVVIDTEAQKRESKLETLFIANRR